jgi:adenine-specific DNA-methyltransferase
VEQMDYINTVTCPRVQKVIEKENFIYCELKKYNQDFIDQIQNTKDTKELLKIWNNMKSKGFLDYNADLAKQDESVEEFKQLSLAQQKQILIELLDKNQLYMNLSEMNDKTNNVSKEDMVLTNEFYK